MPMPTPRQDEQESDFVDRCMGDQVMNRDYPDAPQRRAVCQRQWDDAQGSSARSARLHTYRHVAAIVFGEPWAITVGKFAEITGAMSRILAGDELAPDEVAAIVAARPARPPPRAGAAVALIPLMGTIAHRAGTIAESSGGVSTERLAGELRAAASDPGVSAIVLDVDSPGGTVNGLTEVVDEVRAARARKPVVAVANSLMASAAYWIGSAADEVVATPGSQLGSIGVVAAHQDVSEALAMRGVKTTLVSYGRYKVEGSPFGPLDADALAHMQSQVDYYGEMFVKSVARGRGVGVERVRKDFGEGRLFHNAAAVSRGMADRTATLDQVVGELASGRWIPPPMPAERAAIEPEPPTPEPSPAGGQVAADHETAAAAIALRRRRLGLAR